MPLRSQVHLSTARKTEESLPEDLKMSEERSVHALWLGWDIECCVHLLKRYMTILLKI